MMHGIQYDAWFLRYRARQVEFFVILDYSLHFYPLNNPEKQNFEKMKKIPGDIIILHMCTINQNHMMYGSWDMEHNRYNFSHFKWLFALLHPNNPDNQSFEKMKKKTSGDIIILHKCTKNHDHMLYCSQDMIHGRLLFFILGYFLPFYSPNSPKNQN